MLLLVVSTSWEGGWLQWSVVDVAVKVVGGDAHDWDLDEVAKAVEREEAPDVEEDEEEVALVPPVDHETEAPGRSWLSDGFQTSSL